MPNRLHFLLLAAVSLAVQGQYRRAAKREEFVTSKRMHEVLDLGALPAEVDWRMKDGRNFTTVPRNQHIPQYCGACYAFGSTSALADRIRIATGGAGAEVNLAVQVVLNCDRDDFGCSGGDGLTVYHFIKKQGGIPDETCQPYESSGHDTGRTCEEQDVCKVCDERGCRARPSYPVWSVAQYGSVAGQQQMMAELQRGPIACGIATPPSFINWLGWDVYLDPSHDHNIDHIISVVGYGSEDGKDYWILRNSWGTYWGFYGFARIARGSNTIAIEEDCVWAVPSNEGRPMWRHIRSDAENATASRGQVQLAAPASADEEASRTTPVAARKAMRGAAKELAQNVSELSGAKRSETCRLPVTDWAAVGGERVTGPRPHEVLAESDVPREWDWRYVDGRSYVSWNTNEALPHGSCASCWAQAVTSALADRIAVRRGGHWPQVGLSPQMLLNCRAGGSCSGGDPAGAYDFMYRRGITDQTCQNYLAEDLSCEAKHICRNCAPGGEHGLVWPGHCVAVKEPIVYYVSQFGSVRGAFPMKAEIYQRGPITCGLESTQGFRSYAGGVYSEMRPVETLTHQVSIAGWGASHEDRATDDIEYWVGRNSWGTAWGELGWFRLQMHAHNLGVETDCDWGVPTTASQVPSTTMASPGDGPNPLILISVSLFLVVAMSTAFVVARRRRLQAASEDSDHYVRVE